MNPVKNKHFNSVYGAEQPEYGTLPAHKSEDGIATTCWELSEDDLKTISKTKKIFISLMTFGNPLQPIKVSTDIHDVISLQACESCEVETDIEIMVQDNDSNWFCPKCWEELEPVMNTEYQELKENGELD